jgi:hypothetical protein
MSMIRDDSMMDPRYTSTLSCVGPKPKPTISSCVPVDADGRARLDQRFARAGAREVHPKPFVG